MCSIQGLKVRELVAWSLFQLEGFGVWARVFDSGSEGSRFGGFTIEGFEIWARVLDYTSKGSRFGRPGFLTSFFLEKLLFYMKGMSIYEKVMFLEA